MYLSKCPLKLEILTPGNPKWCEVLSILPHDIYHTPGYLVLESKKYGAVPEAFLLSDGDKYFFLPYLVREINDLPFEHSCFNSKQFDIVSPYGYPGILTNMNREDSSFFEIAIEQFKEEMAKRSIQSAFIRLHPILNENLYHSRFLEYCHLSGETVSVNLQLSEKEIWSQTRKDQRNKINKCKRLGMTAKVVDFQDEIATFMDIYHETMNRVNAKEFYYFNSDYFRELAINLEGKLFLCLVEYESQYISAGIYSECCGIVQGVLGGTRTRFLKQSPTSLETDFVRLWAKQRGNRFLHLGGGLGGSQDSLFKFKSGFSKQRHNFLTMRIVPDQEKYQFLVRLRADQLNLPLESLMNSRFFPAYRAAAGL